MKDASNNKAWLTYPFVLKEGLSIYVALSIFIMSANVPSKGHLARGSESNVHDSFAHKQLHVVEMTVVAKNKRRFIH